MKNLLAIMLTVLLAGTVLASGHGDEPCDDCTCEECTCEDCTCDDCSSEECTCEGMLPVPGDLRELHL